MSTSFPVSAATLVGVGVGIAAAVKCALETQNKSMRSIATDHGLDAKNFGRLINGSARSGLYQYREVLASELGVSREWLDAQLNGAK